MKLLALETSAKAVSAAVVDGETVLASVYQCTGLTHSRTLMPMVQSLLANADLTLRQMDGIAVAAGPGSFTGIRIGVSTAKGLAFSENLPVCAVSTLEAMAQGVRQMDGLILCAMDARRQQIYNAVFEAHNGKLTRLTPDRAIPLMTLCDEIKNIDKRKIVVGDGANLCYTTLLSQNIEAGLAPPHLVMQNAIGVGQVAQKQMEAGLALSAQDLAPVYLRISQAERERNERLKKEQTT